MKSLHDAKSRRESNFLELSQPAPQSSPNPKKTDMSTQSSITRRQFLVGSAACLLAARFARAETAEAKADPEPVIDIHQHTPYSGRNDAEMIAHQRRIGITQTVLLPAGSPVEAAITHGGRSNGLAAGAGGNEAVLAVVREHPNEFFFFANEVPNLPNAREVLEKYLKLGAKGIGEQKFGVESDSSEIAFLAELAREYDVPVLLHFQEGKYNSGLERFHKVLEKFPDVNFIGHAQSWWGNIDANHDPKVLYPKGPVAHGGITDRLLSDYPNMFADQSAGSGLNALLRDEEHARRFLEKHQDKILFGTDCSDAVGHGEKCQGARTLATIRRLAPNKAAERKILYRNAQKLLQL